MEKALIFRNNRIADYWFKYTCRFFKENKVEVLMFEHERRILFKEFCLVFLGYIDEHYLIGRKNMKLYFNMEEKMEKNYSKILKEILKDGEETKGE